MGFAEANPRQLAPTVGKTHVGFTISAVPAIDNSATSSAIGSSATSPTTQMGPDLLGTLCNKQRIVARGELGLWRSQVNGRPPAGGPMVQKERAE